MVLQAAGEDAKMASVGLLQQYLTNQSGIDAAQRDVMVTSLVADSTLPVSASISTDMIKLQVCGAMRDIRASLTSAHACHFAIDVWWVL